jgi:hypothetical protein
MSFLLWGNLSCFLSDTQPKHVVICPQKWHSLSPSCYWLDGDAIGVMISEEGLELGREATNGDWESSRYYIRHYY